MSEFYGRVGIICMLEETMEIFTESVHFMLTSNTSGYYLHVRRNDGDFLRVGLFHVDIIYESKPGKGLGEGRILQSRNSKSGTEESPCRLAASDVTLLLAYLCEHC